MKKQTGILSLSISLVLAATVIAGQVDHTDEEFIALLNTATNEINNDVQHVPEGITYSKNKSYNEQGKVNDYHRMNICDGDDSKLRPALIYLHGGGWAAGDYHQGVTMCSYFALVHNFYAVSLRYRLTTEGYAFPAHIEDVKCAVRYIRANAASLNVDPNKIAITGGSAGGHLSALAAVTNGLAFHDTVGGWKSVSGDVNASIPLCGIFDLRGKSDSLNLRIHPFMGGTESEVPQNYIDASPITHIASNASNVPPIRYEHGEADATLPAAESEEMHDSCIALGIDSELKVWAGKSHGWFNPNKNFDLRNTIGTIETFLTRIFELETPGAVNAKNPVKRSVSAVRKQFDVAKTAQGKWRASSQNSDIVSIEVTNALGITMSDIRTERKANGFEFSVPVKGVFFCTAQFKSGKSFTHKVVNQ